MKLERHALWTGLVMAALLVGYYLLTRDTVADCMERASRSPTQEGVNLALAACDKKFPGELRAKP